MIRLEILYKVPNTHKYKIIDRITLVLFLAQEVLDLCVKCVEF